MAIDSQPARGTEGTPLLCISYIDILGSRDGAVVRALASHQCGPGSIPGLGVICGLSLLLVLVLAPRGFSPGTPVFPSPQKPTFPNSNSILTQWKKSHSVDPLLIPIFFFFNFISATPRGMAFWFENGYRF